MNLENTNLQYHPDIIDPPIKIHKTEEPANKHDELYEINDIRSSSDFKGITFSNYKKSDVKQKLIECLLGQNIEPACYWSAEMICAGHFTDLREIILYYISKYIHLGNPNIAIYIEMRYTIFKNIMNLGTFISDIDARNNQSIRQVFSEIMCVLSYSNKKPSFEQIKIQSENDFDSTQIATKLKADDITYVEETFKKKDPRELFIAMNEFAFALSEKGSNMANAGYWLEWCLEFESICKKKKIKILCEPRNYITDNKFRSNIVWIIWDIIFHYATLNKNPLIHKNMTALVKLFTIKFTDATSKKPKIPIDELMNNLKISEKPSLNFP